MYLKAIDACLALGRGALLLVPEIALTPAMAGQFFQRFGEPRGDSAFRLPRRRARRAMAADSRRACDRGGGHALRRLRAGAEPRADRGRRRARPSYKQQETPRYNGRDVAVVRAQAAGACVVLGSATPSLESRYNAERGKYTLLALPERIEERPMPDVELIDMRQEFLETRKQATFSRALLDAIGERLKNGEQTMLLLNRRGFSSFVACRACGERVECINCSRDADLSSARPADAVPLLRLRRRRFRRVCPKCESEHIHFMGPGSERVEDELHREFPEARIARMDRDTVSGKRHFETILQGFREGDFDILVGTQMIAKGHDIPNVTLVGVVSADIGLGMPDFRAAERTFQLLTQAAGRAGRGNLPGIVLIQTINPEHYAVRFARRAGLPGFLRQGDSISKTNALSAVQRAGQCAGAQPRSRRKRWRMSCGTRPAARSRARRFEGAGSGGSAGAEVRRRISLPAFDQGREPETAQ